ncbi:hypothetical protein SOPP22_10835 [Shewanella sp. OPT22]|nr:hypothetical protein SOPP22_10835 [Shewanella sp. OPT22]
MDEIQRKLDILKQPLDIETYIEKGLISRYKNTKSKFILNCNLDELPEELEFRITEMSFLNPTAESIKKPAVVKFDLKVHK